MLRTNFRDLSRQTLSRGSQRVFADTDNLRNDTLNAPWLTRDRRLDLPHVRGSWVSKLFSHPENTDNLAPDKPILLRTQSCGSTVESTKNVTDPVHADDSQACLDTVIPDDLFDVVEPNNARRLQSTANTKLTLSLESKCRVLSRPSTPFPKSRLSFSGVEIAFTRSSSI